MAQQQTLGQKLEKIRQDANLTETALAKRIGISWDTYRKFRDGTGTLSESIELKIRAFTENPSVRGSKKVRTSRQSKKTDGLSREHLEFVLSLKSGEGLFILGVMMATGQDRLGFTQIEELLALKK